MRPCLCRSMNLYELVGALLLRVGDKSLPYCPAAFRFGEPRAFRPFLQAHRNIDGSTLPQGTSRLVFARYNFDNRAFVRPFVKPPGILIA